VTSDAFVRLKHVQSGCWVRATGAYLDVVTDGTKPQLAQA
jgi:hypothetical protein